MRCRCPPLSWWGYFSRTSSPRIPTIFKASSIRSRPACVLGGQLKVFDYEVKNVFDPVERVVDCVGILKNRLDLACVLQLLARGSLLRYPDPR
jgi:hypothetical protein